MATNYKGDDDKITVVAPHAVVSGRFVVVNSTTGFGGVAQANAASAADVVIQVGGVYEFAKANAASTSATAGAAAYWDNTNAAVTISATSNTKIGVFVAAVANTDTIAQVRLNEAF
jgi:predicted RecA/RadA family phage recombinase